MTGVILSIMQSFMARTKPFKRGAHSKRSTQPVSIPIPRSWENSINTAISRLDTDRSKLVRSAVKEKLERMGINVPLNAA